MYRTTRDERMYFGVRRGRRTGGNLKRLRRERYTTIGGGSSIKSNEEARELVIAVAMN